ncbi:hypothetical protein EYS14_03285 [Alteromonadaceae bacterium M269]|nr:hypothetical protein EYS14_03285 [Alteromonadaceae bacterium M269]
MKNFPFDFEKLQDAQDYKVPEQTYRVSSAAALVWLVETNIWKTLREIQADRQNPLYSMADVVISSAEKNTYFDVDPDSREGQGILRGIEAFKIAKVFTQAQVDEFLNLSSLIRRPYKDKTQQDWDNGLLRVKTPAQTLTYEDGRQYHIRQPNKLVKVFVHLDAPAPVDLVIDIYDLQRPSSALPFVPGSVKCGYMKINQGELGQYTILNKNFSEHVQFNLVSDTAVSFEATITEA